MSTVSVCRLPGCGRRLDDGLYLFYGWHWYDLSPKQRLDYLRLLTNDRADRKWLADEIARTEARLIRHLQRKFLR